MKKIRITILFCLMVTILDAQQIIVITSSNFVFSPSDVIVDQGDIVRFDGSSSHPVIQISLSTYNANGTTLLPGGFSFPSGSGDYTTTTPGTFYFACANHGGSGMKGTIVVNTTTGFKDLQDDYRSILFPNPASDFIICQTGSKSLVNKIEILDISGKTVMVNYKPEFSNNQLRIDIARLSRGMYFIMIKSVTGISSGKFIKS